MRVFIPKAHVTVSQEHRSRGGCYQRWAALSAVSEPWRVQMHFGSFLSLRWPVPSLYGNGWQLPQSSPYQAHLLNLTSFSTTGEAGTYCGSPDRLEMISKLSHLLMS